MRDAPNWYARKYSSLVARSHESDPDAEFHIRQTGNLSHVSRLTTVEYGDAFVLDLRDKGGLAMSGAIHDDALTAVFIWGEGTTFNGQPSPIPQLRILGPGTEFNLELPGNYRLMRIGIRGQMLEALSDQWIAGSDSHWLLPGVLEQPFAPTVELELQQKLLRTARYAEVAAQRGYDLTAGLAVGASEAGAALALVLSGQASRAFSVLGSRERREIVDATLAILAAKPLVPVSISAVCEALGVGERMLERAFQERLGISPRAYERQRRLRAAHGLILTDGDHLSITEIAMSVGFWHLGRFAGAYAALFGTSPSETRQRVWSTMSDD